MPGRLGRQVDQVGIVSHILLHPLENDPQRFDIIDLSLLASRNDHPLLHLSVRLGICRVRHAKVNEGSQTAVPAEAAARLFARGGAVLDAADGIQTNETALRSGLP